MEGDKLSHDNTNWQGRYKLKSQDHISILYTNDNDTFNWWFFHQAYSLNTAIFLLENFKKI